jgi:hypothetical protein
MSVLQPSPAQQPNLDLSAIINDMCSLLAVAVASSNASIQGNVLTHFSTLLQQSATVKNKKMIATSPRVPSPLDDLENVTGITLNDKDSELDLNENPMITLKKRFPRLDTNLRHNLEMIGEELQECTLEVKKRKKSYGMFVVSFGSDA